MSREESKQAYELAALLRFLDQSGLEVARESIVHGDPNRGEPDFLVSGVGGIKTGVELCRLINPDLAQSVNRRQPINGEYIRTRDYSPDIVGRKLSKRYAVECLVDLVLYKEHPQITPDNVAIPSIERMCKTGAHCYSRIWFLGDEVKKLYERA
jgi:hypothetical protein